MWSIDYITSTILYIIVRSILKFELENLEIIFIVRTLGLRKAKRNVKLRAAHDSVAKENTKIISKNNKLIYISISSSYPHKLKVNLLFGLIRKVKIKITTQKTLFLFSVSVH